MSIILTCRKQISHNCNRYHRKREQLMGAPLAAPIFNSTSYKRTILIVWGVKEEWIMITLFLASVIGWYLVIICLLVLFRTEHVKSVASDIMARRDAFFIIALMTLILGLLMVVSHNIWIMGWPVIITVIAWLVLISGILRLFCPEIAPKMSRCFLENTTCMRVTAVVLLLIGAYLLYQVYYLSLPSVFMLG